MVKRRERPANKKDLTSDAVEEFASGADTNDERSLSSSPTAKRDYKSVRMNFNKFEYNALERLSRSTGRSKMGAIRWAVVQMAEQEAK